LFFVLSGYLITGLLVDKGVHGSRVTLSKFYAQRTRRLMPALALMLIAVGVAVHFWEPSWQWSTRRGDLISTLFYYANWHFIASDQSYFEQFGSVSPLRHVWSLAIEEQFYLVWPLLVALAARWLAGGHRWRRVAVAAGLVGGTVSSAVTMVAVYDPAIPTRAYVGTDARAQQVLIGALLALAVRQAAARRAMYAERAAAWMAFAAVAATVALMLTVSDKGGFYFHGGATLAALVFAVLIWTVETAPAAVVARAFSWWPLRATGRISYGLYLWHWPVILFLPETLLAGLPALPVRIAATLVLAVGSYHLVEAPIRRGRPSFAVATPRRVAFAAATALAGCATVSVLATGGRAVPGELQTGELAAGTSTVQQEHPTPANRLPIPAPAARTGPVVVTTGCGPDDLVCERVHVEPGQPVFAVIGDSVARSLDAGMIDMAMRAGWGYVLAARIGCGVAGLVTFLGPQPTEASYACQRDVPPRIRRALDAYHPQLVIAFSRWEAVPHVLPDGTVVQAPTDRWAADVHDGLVSLARTVTGAGARLALVGTIPLIYSDAECRRRGPDAEGCIRRPDPLTDAHNRVIRTAAADVPNTDFVGMLDAICPADRCDPVVDGVAPLYDGVHFSPAGARWFTTKLESRLRKKCLLEACPPR
jgi:peptidoglycan/LPS O-acetylase OafA/YrhL